jgi:hypothetical protein
MMNKLSSHLRAVGVRAGVGHRKQPGLGVRQGKVLVGEAGAVDGLAARAGAVGEVATLDHEADFFF